VSRVGVFPGSFDPPTVAHLAIAEAAREQCRLDRLDLVVSRVPLGKDHTAQTPVDERVSLLTQLAEGRPWLGVSATDARLLADVAAGYDVLVVGADKWAQLHDPSWYGGSTDERDAALARLPQVVVAPRAGFPTPVGVPVLDVDPAHHHVSSSAVRAGRKDWRAGR
jgi:nicotinic acid mononucleotide adenylyltransferase